MTITYVKIASVAVGVGGAASIDFSSIPATYTDLLLIASTRTNNTNRTQQLFLNNDTTQANYAYRTLDGNGSAASSGNSANAYMFQSNISTDTASTFGSGQFYIPNYAGSTAKSFSVDSVAETNASASMAEMLAGKWSGTAVINQITLTPFAGSWVQYSTAVLYGIKSS